MKIFLASSSRVALPVLDGLRAANLLAGIISSPDKPVGRGRKFAPNEFAAFCEENGYVVHKPGTSRELNVLLEDEAPDLVVTVAYGKLIKSSELLIPKSGWLNVHFSRLPRWRGAAPVQRALLAGDTLTGITIFQLDEEMDTGPIYVTTEHPILEEDTTESLLTKLSHASVEPLLKAISMIQAGIKPVSQSAEGVTLAPKISKSDGRINWNLTSVEIERMIRALNPWPLAWTQVQDSRILITQARSSTSRDVEGTQAGHVITLDPFTIACKDSALEVLAVKPEGKREMLAAEWLRGVRNPKEIHFV